MTISLPRPSATQAPPAAVAAPISPDRIAAAVTLAALGLRQSLHVGVTSGLVLAVLLLPVWVGTVRRYRWGRVVVAGFLVTIAAGYLLSRFAQATHWVVAGYRSGSIALLLGVACTVGVVLWARTLMTPSAIGGWYGLGMLAGPLLRGMPAQDNAWKFVWAVPVALVLLALAGRARRPRGVELPALLLLAFLSVRFDSRSYFATFVLAALLLLWQMRPRAPESRGSPAVTMLLMAAIAIATYFVGTTLLVDGYLGRAAQERSIAQIQTSGSLILGGRPELQATWALMRARPQGFGLGVMADPNDILVAKTGLNSIDYNPNNGYVEKYMFGRQVELHSVTGDLWAQAGFVGLGLSVLIAVVVVWSTAVRIAAHEASALLLFLVLWTLWNLLFSPLFAAAPTLGLALGLVLLPKAGGGRPVTRPG